MSSEQAGFPEWWAEWGPKFSTTPDVHREAARAAFMAGADFSMTNEGEVIGITPDGENEYLALVRDARRYRGLRDMKCNHFHLTLNGDHAPNYMTAADWIDEDPQWYADNTPDELAEMGAANTIWCLQIYPDTPNGFYHFDRATLDAAIDAAMEAAK